MDDLILTRVISVAKKHSGNEDIREGDRIKLLGFDSLDLVEFSMGLEEEFGIEIGDSEFSDDTTLLDVVAIVRAKTCQ